MMVFFLAAIFVVCFCHSPHSKSSPPTTALDFQDKIFLNEDTLQLVIEKPNDFKSEPLVYKRKRLCQEAEKEILTKLYELYPKSKKFVPKTEIRHKLYTEGGGCLLVVQYHAPNLRKDIQ